MREAHNPNLIQFRANERLVSAVAAQARAHGVSVSEYLRTVVREKVGVQ